MRWNSRGELYFAHIQETERESQGYCIQSATIEVPKIAREGRALSIGMGPVAGLRPSAWAFSILMEQTKAQKKEGEVQTANVISFDFIHSLCREQSRFRMCWLVFEHVSACSSLHLCALPNPELYQSGLQTLTTRTRTMFSASALYFFMGAKASSVPKRFPCRDLWI